MCDNDCPLAESLVAIRMVTVPVGVGQETYFAISGECP
jgi:hypothetical protein